MFFCCYAPFFLVCLPINIGLIFMERNIMQKLFSELHQRLSLGENAVLCSIIAASGSVPRGAGAKMLVFADGHTAGTVGGGSVELHARKNAMDILGGSGSSMVAYSLGKGEIGDIGMICGGNVRIFFRLFTPSDAPLAQKIAAQAAKSEDSYLIYVIDGDAFSKLFVYKPGEPLPDGLDSARILPLLGNNAIYSRGDDADIFAEPLSRPGRALIFGAGHVARALAPVLKSIGLPVYVYDNRAPLLSREYFPDADGLIYGSFTALSASANITRSDAVFVMTPGHEADYDVLLNVLPSPAHYIGCIGSRHKAARTRERLKLAGFSGDDIVRVRCPVGFNIGAEAPAEIAISIAAELIAVNSGIGGVIPWPEA